MAEDLAYEIYFNYPPCQIKAIFQVKVHRRDGVGNGMRQGRFPT
jgi:hypothetical protein